MGEAQGTLFSPEYNRSIQVEARPEKLTSDATGEFGTRSYVAFSIAETVRLIVVKVKLAWPA